jgi:hypothetical protein
MLGILAAILIVLWLLGFFAFHITAGFIHIVLVVGIVLLVLHLFTGRRPQYKWPAGFAKAGPRRISKKSESWKTRQKYRDGGTGSPTEPRRLLDFGYGID